MKHLTNQEIRAYEGGDFDVIMDNYNEHQIFAAIANRLGKIRRSNG